MIRWFFFFFLKILFPLLSVKYYNNSHKMREWCKMRSIASGNETKSHCSHSRTLNSFSPNLFQLNFFGLSIYFEHIHFFATVICGYSLARSLAHCQSNTTRVFINRSFPLPLSFFCYYFERLHEIFGWLKVWLNLLTIRF